MDGEKDIKEGQWDSIHCFTVEEQGGGKWRYDLFSTVFLRFMNTPNKDYGVFDVAGTLNRKVREVLR